MSLGFSFKSMPDSNEAFRKRAWHIIMIVIVLMLILFARLVFLQIFQQHYYQTMSSKNSISLVPLPPSRGLIYDRYGDVLAENMPVYSLDITPDKITDLTHTITALHKFIQLTPEDLRLFYRQVKQHRSFDEVPLKVKLTPEEVAQFYVNQYKFPGVKVVARLIRYYPNKGDMVDFLGYTGRINQQELSKLDEGNYAATNYIGKLGLERYFEQELHGTTGAEEIEVDASGRTVRELSRTLPVAGDNLYLTIDSGLQQAAVNAMKNYRGAVVAIDPRNGQVLAMVSSPSYDPNLFVRGISNNDYQTLRNSPDQPLFNRSIRGLYSPGSTVKPIYALQGLKMGYITPEQKIFDPGYFQLPGLKHKYRDWKKHNWVNLNKAIAQSCDTYFYILVNKMGIDNLDTVLHAFGFGSNTGLEIKEQESGLVPTPQWRRQTRNQHWYKGDTLIVGIGQGSLLVTPLQLAVMTSIIAERGVHYQPTLIDHITHADGTISKHLPVLLPKVVFSDQHWQSIIDGMVSVVRSIHGTGYRFGHPSYPVAAKTGTVQLFTVGQDQKYDEMDVTTRLKDNSTFIAFAPVDHPKIAIAVAVQNNPNASIVARKVLDYYLVKQDHIHDVLPGQENKNGN
jgi:penicillin-binding protein 2